METNVTILKPTIVYSFLMSVSNLMFAGFLYFLGLNFTNASIFFTIGTWWFGLRFIYRFFYIRSFTYKFYDDHVLYSYGLFSTQSFPFEYYRIRTQTSHASLLMRIIGVMNINVYTTNVANGQFTIWGVPKSTLLYNLRENVNINRSLNNVHNFE